MPATKSASALLFAANTVVAAGTTRTSPVIGNTIDCTAGYGGDAYLQIANGATGPAAGCVIELQGSADGSTGWTFYDQIIGDLLGSAAGGGASGVLPVDIGVKYVRPIAFGNTVNAVTVNGQFTQVTGL